MKVIYFYHIPKCGGTFINTYLRNVSERLNSEYKNFNTLKSKKVNEKRDNWITTYLSNIVNKNEEFIFIHHHHGFPGLADLYNTLLDLKENLKQGGHEFQMFTCIRDPVAQFTSRLNFLINTGQGESLTIQRLLHNKTLSNNMYKYLLYNHPERYSPTQDLSAELFNKVLKLFDRIFLLENVYSIQQWLQSITNCETKMPDKAINKSEHHIKPSLTEKEEIKLINNLDMHFYNLVKQST